VSLAALSQLVHFSKGYLSKVENGERSATAGLARSCDEVLGADGALTDLVIGRAQSARTRTARPAQLPAAVAHFTGRAWPMEQLDTTDAAVTLISGPPGVGKTALVLHWAHQVLARFPDGCLFADLRGYTRTGSPAEPTQILDGFLRGIGAVAETVPATLEARSALLRTLLVGKRMLIILDNAAAPDQVRPLLPGAADCQVIVTSRSRMSGLVARDAAIRVILDPLPPPEADALLTRILGPDRAGAEPDAAAEIAQRCGYLPLALRIAADRAAARPRLRLADLARQLSAERDRLDVLATSDDDATTIRSVFSWSYQALPPTVARMFRLLGLHPGPDIGIPAAAALAGVTPPQARRLLETLTAVHLLEETGIGRYRCHDLLRLYAAEQARAEETEDDAAAAMRRMLGWYVHTADAADRVLLPPRRHLRLDTPGPGWRPLSFAGYEQALSWFDAEHANLAAAVRLADEIGEYGIAWKLPTALWSFFNLRKPWDEWISTGLIGLASARRAGDRPGEAQILNILGPAYGDLDQLDEAIACFEQSLAIRRETGDRNGEGSSASNLGASYFRQGRFAEALACCQQALPIFREIGNKYLEGIALVNLGETYRALRRLADALDCFREVLATVLETGDRYHEAMALHNIGDIQHDLGQPGEAIGHYRQALSIRRDLGDRQGEAITLHRLGDARSGTGQAEAAQEAWRQALAIYEDLGDPQAARLRERLGEGTAPRGGQPGPGESHPGKGVPEPSADDSMVG